MRRKEIKERGRGFRQGPRAWCSILAALMVGCAVFALSGCGVSMVTPAKSSGAAGSLALSTKAVDFGSVMVGQTASETVTATNAGSSTIQISMTVTGQGFSLPGTGTTSVTLAKGASYIATIKFAPTAAGTANGSLSVTSSSDPMIVALTGTGETTPAGVLTSLSCAANSMSGPGTDKCTVNLTEAAGSGGLAVTLSSSSAAIAVPSSVTVASGATSGSFAAMVSAVTASQKVTLTASAAGVTKTYVVSLGVGAATLTLQSTSVAFGDVSLNSPSTQAVVLTSSGAAPVTVSAASISGDPGFSITSPSFPVTIPAGQSTTLYLQFDPASAGSFSGGATLKTTNAGTAVIHMTGTGVTTSYQVSLTWDAPTNSTDRAVSYDIYRAANGSASYLMLGTSGGTSYNDSTVSDGTTYAYYVTSVDDRGNQSAPSNTFTIRIP